MRYFAIVLSVILLIAYADLAPGYEVIEVKNGVTLKGQVSIKGDAPRDETIVIDKDIEYCGKEKKVGRYIVKDSKVKDVVIWIEGVKKGKEIPEVQVPVTIRKCMATPHVSVGFVGGEFILRNDDEILHTIQLKLGLAYQKMVSRRPLEDGATIYNLALPTKGEEIIRPIKWWHRYTPDTGFIQITSNTHTWIKGYIFIFDHPYAVVTDENGLFTISDIPKGEYILRVWHEALGTQERKISLTDRGVVEVHIAFER